MVVVRIHVAKQHRNAIHIVDDHVDLAVVEDVAKCGAAANADDCKPGSLDRRNQLELAVLQVVVQKRALAIAGPPLRVFIHFRIDVPIDDQQIFPPVIVVVEESVGKTDKRNGRFRDAGLIADIGEKTFSVILEQDIVVVGKVGIHYGKVTVVLVVSCRNAHIGDLAATLIERVSAFVTLIFERPIALVHVEIVRRGVIGHQQVRLAITVHVRKQSPQAVVSVGIVHPQLLADIRKISVSIVVKEMVPFTLQAARTAHHLHPAVLAESKVDGLCPGKRRIGQVKLKVAGHEKVQPPVAVVVAEGCARGPRADCDAGFFRDIRKGSVVVIVVKAVLPIIGYIQVRPAVIVVIPNHAPVSPPVVGYAGLLRYVGERAIVVVVKQSRVRWCSFARKRIVSRAVHQINVKPAVIVIVQKTDARALGFQNKTLFGSARRVMPARKSSSCGNILKDYGAGFYKAAGGDGAVLAIELRLLRTGTGHSALGFLLLPFLDSPCCRGRTG